MELCAVAVTYILVLQKAARNTKILFSAFLGSIPSDLCLVLLIVCSAQCGKGALYFTDAQNSCFSKLFSQSDEAKASLCTWCHLIMLNMRLGTR